MIISQKKYNSMVKLIEESSDLILRQNKMIHQMQEEIKQQEKLIGLYEACITKGVQIDFPDVTGREKGEDNNDPGTDIFFDL